MSDDLVIAFARARLGPASARCLSEPGARIEARTRIDSGADPTDTALALAHAAARTDRAVADEFVAYFLQDLLRLGHGRLAPALRRFLDTGDLVQSVLGDLGSDLFTLRFESRLSFVSLLAQRLRWKASDAARRQGTLRRDGQRTQHEPSAPEDASSPSALEQLAAPGPSPPSLAAAREARERLALVLPRLSPNDRDLLRRRLRGEKLADIAQARALSLEAAKKAVQRALGRARDILT